MIVITGAAGFIGSVMVSYLNQNNFKDLVLVDDFSKLNKKPNYFNKQYSITVERNNFFEWLNNNHKFVQIIIHLGARTDTTEFDENIFNELNYNYSINIWKNCVKYGLPLIYASSAATYGAGEFGYNDDENIIPQLSPLNPYGVSKNNFDKWALSQNEKPYFWAGFKFFNVFGPNEYHKGRMASVIFHAYNQIKQNGNLKLFKSHLPKYNDGEQKRDFVYVLDVVSVLFYFMQNRKKSGIYNLGTGKANTFNFLANSVFNALNIKPEIEYVDIPLDIKDKYQYFTQANINKLRLAGYTKPFYDFETAICEYVTKYLSNKIYY